MARLKEKYMKEVIGKLIKLRHYKNSLQVPVMKKIVVNMGINTSVDKNIVKSLLDDLAKITGQCPVICKARKSIASFKLRKGMPIGALVTLRSVRMYEFYDRLINTVLPRLRDFRGLSPDGFDGHGNYTLGVSDQTIFPEINPDDIKKTQGMNITIITTAATDEEASDLLVHMGMPFAARKAEN